MKFRKKSKIMESRLASRIGGRRVPMSGGGRMKGDVVTDRFLVEHKFTGGSSFRVSLRAIEKISGEALQSGKDWAFVIEFPGDRECHKIAIVSEAVWKELL